jgi:APA family basic amino acid/polyamine antiporter
MTMAAVGIFLFRKRKNTGDAQGYRVPLYPVVPLIFILISVWFLASTLIGRPIQAVAGLSLMVIGLPVYLYFKKSKANTA